MKRLLTHIRWVLLLIVVFTTASWSQTWITQTPTGSSTALFSVKAVSATVVWACGSAGTVWRTTNGGSNWSRVPIPATTLNCYSIDAISANIAWVVAVNPTGNTSQLYKTTDGGLTWTSKVSSTTSGTFYNAVRFFDANTGVLTGDVENGYFVIYTTTDGGERWVRTASVNIPPPASTGEFGLTDCLAISGKSVWFGTGNPSGATVSTRVFRSTDQGLTWRASGVISGLGNAITSLEFVNESNGLLIGENGTVMRTRDGGATWTDSRVTGLSSGSGLEFATPTSVFAVGTGGSIVYLSTDFGSTWSSRAPTFTDPLFGISFANSSTGWAVGSVGQILKWNGGTLPGGILTEVEPNNIASQAMAVTLGDSVNASIATASDVDYYRFTASAGDTVEILAYATGTSNVEMALQLYASGGTELAYNDYFITINDARILYALPSTGTYYVRVSSFGSLGSFPNSHAVRPRVLGEEINSTGASAQSVSRPTLSFGQADPTGEYRIRMKRFTATAPYAFTAGVGNLYSTTGWAYGYVFPNGLPTTVTVHYGTTTSYGQSASAGTVSGLDPTYPFAPLTGLSPGTTYNYRIVATNARGQFISGNDTFVTPPAPVGWSVQASPTTETLWGVHSASATVSTAVGDNGTILRTTNAGVSWVQQTSNTNETLRSVAFVSTSTGIAVGTGGTILRTADGGANWTSIVSGTTNFLRGVSFSTTAVAVAVGSNGTILRSTNGGLTWVSQTSGTTSALRGVVFVDANAGWAVGGAGIILKTTDGGTTWTTQTSNTTNSLIGVSFVDANNGVAVGENGTILRTTNGGTTWSLQNSGTSETLWAVRFADANNGVIGGGNGLILRTTNGGSTWTVQATGTYNTVLGISVSGTAVTAVGEYGMILRSASASTPTITVSTSSISFGSVIVGSSSQQTFTVTCPSTSPASLSVTNIASSNTAFTVSPTNFTLAAGGSQTVTVTFSPTSGGAHSATITLTHNASGGSSTVTATGTGEARSSGISTSTGRFSAGIPASAWVLMSVPYTLDNPSATVLASQLTGSNAWKMYAYVAGNYQDISSASDAFQLGRGFWFKTVARSSAFNLSFGAGSLVTGTSYQITVPTGWTLVGPPFYNNEATWSPVNTTAGSSGIRVWKYAHESNSWQGPLNPTVERMKPFGGYAVYNQTGSAQTFTFTRGPTTIGSVREWNEGDGWYALIKVGTASLRVGSHRLAKMDGDFYDYPSPPAPPEAAVESPSLDGRLWSDIRSSDYSGVMKWRILVQPGAANSLVSEELFGLPSGWKLVATGIPNAGVVELEPGRQVPLPQLSTSYAITLVAGRRDEVEHETVPASFSLGQNYPNPFNPSTSISYQLSAPSDVTLVIYNVIGKEVATLVQTFQQPGAYEVRWDGKDAAGELMPSGIYFYTLRAGQFTATKKMLFVR